LPQKQKKFEVNKRNLTLAEKPKAVFNEFRDYYNSIPFLEKIFCIVLMLLFILMNIVYILIYKEDYVFVCIDIYLYIAFLALSRGLIRSIILV
jgi:hypothetical protein